MDDYEQYCTVKPSFVVERIVEQAEKELCPKVPFPPIVQGQRIHTFKLTPRVLIAIFGTVSVSAIAMYLLYQKYQRILEEREKTAKDRRRIEIEMEDRIRKEIEEKKKMEMEEKKRKKMEEKKRKKMEEIEKKEIEERRKEIMERRRMGRERRKNEVEERNWCVQCWDNHGIPAPCGHYVCFSCMDYDEFKCSMCIDMIQIFGKHICVVCRNQSVPNLMLPKPCGHFSCISCWDYNYEDSCGICTDMDRIFDRY